MQSHANTADGFLRPCLMADGEVDLRTPLRNGASTRTSRNYSLQRSATNRRNTDSKTASHPWPEHEPTGRLMRKAYYPVADVGDLQPGEPGRSQWEQTKTLSFICLAPTEYYASSALCPHQNEPWTKDTSRDAKLFAGATIALRHSNRELHERGAVTGCKPMTLRLRTIT